MELTRQEINDLEIEVFKGEIIVVDNLSQIEDACKNLKQADVIGFDTETKPAFRKGVSNNVALLQLAMSDKCYLFRLNKIEMLPCIIDILTDKNIKKIGLSLKDDFHALGRTHSFHPENFVEIQNLVKQYNIEGQSLQKIYATLFNKRITKGQRLSNWEADKLSGAQQMYAALDAWACWRIYEKLSL